MSFGLKKNTNIRFGNYDQISDALENKLDDDKLMDETLESIAWVEEDYKYLFDKI